MPGFADLEILSPCLQSDAEALLRGMRVLNDYRSQLKEGKEHPVFDPEKFSDLDIDASAWKQD